MQALIERDLKRMQKQLHGVFVERHYVLRRNKQVKMIIRMQNKGAINIVFTSLFSYAMFRICFLSNVGRQLAVCGKLAPSNQSEDSAGIMDVDGIS